MPANRGMHLWSQQHSEYSPKAFLMNKSHFVDTETAYMEIALVMFFSSIALSFAPFFFHPLHAPQAAARNTSQICVLFLQVAFLGASHKASDTVLIIYSCIRPHVGDTFMYPTQFKMHLFAFQHHFSSCLQKYARCCGKKHNSKDRLQASLIESAMFPMSKRSSPLSCFFS